MLRKTFIYQTKYHILKISNETKVGILTVIAITILILGYSYLRGNDVFNSSNRFYALYSSVEGLTVSKPVLVNGFPIGKVSKMQLQPNGQTIVEFKIDDKYNIPTNTLARLESTDLLGSKAIVFELGSSKQFAEDKDTLKADIQGSLAESLQPVQKKAEQLISRMDSTLSSVNKILNPEFRHNVDRSFLSIANSLQTLEGTTKKLDGLVASQTGHINGILENAQVASANLKNTTGHLNTISTNFETVSSDLANARIRETLENVNRTVADLQGAVNKINNGKGSLSLLLNDDQMYKNLNAASGNLNNLFIDIKAHPSRYVSFSVFGHKDK